MKRKLLILRHAKSDWGADYTRDRDRPLNKRGKNDAHLIGKWMAQQQLFPDLVLCSPAKRTRSTLERVLTYSNKLDLKTNYLESLYHADLATLLEAIGNVPDSIQRLLLVGHNPGLDALLVHISKQGPPYTDSGKLMTTANLALLEIPGTYQDIQQHDANLVTLIRPKELGDSF